ncbi:helix-turn-helix domain-containing protein [Paenibacillus sp. LMG 31460]|uniref:Helix-turn-helix domain-containing protein n=2 Tax=Paenibacillus germinis TaxID=2654979 RepID=A0ABX1Z2G2_9BACL|nr:helix-turn-helix domain-containing protein [Paenibacillus germinis]
MKKVSNRMDLARTYLSNTQIHMSTGALTRVRPDWGGTNIIQGENVLYFFLEGEGWLKINNIEYYPVPGELFLVPAGTRISCSTDESNPFLTYWCHFTATVGENNLFDLLITPHCIAMRNDETIKNQFQELITQHESDGLAAPFIVKSLLFHLMSRFIERSTVDPLQTASIPSVHKLYIVLQYIEKHLTEQMTVDMLSQLVHFHPKYFLHYFKSMLGVSPIVYINKKRMQKANSLLLHSDMTIAEIAEQLGMQTPYLSRMFKRFTGFSPNEFRQQHRMSQRL